MRKNFTFLFATLCLFLSQPLLAQTNAFKLNGTNFITGQDPIFSTGGQAFSVEFWANIPHGSKDGNFHEILGEGDVGDSASFYIGYDGNGFIDIADTWGPTNVSMPFDVWTHFAVTYDGNYTTLYVNGVEQFTNNNLGYGGSGANLAIGTSADLTVPLFAGTIQNLAIYNDARTAAQVKSDLFNTNTSDPTLTVFYSMNTPDGTTIDNTATTGNSELGVIHGDDGSNSYTTSPVQFSSNALAFDGLHDTVTIPANSAYDLGTGNGGTIEFWVNPATLSSNFATVLGNRGNGVVEYSIHLSSTQVGVDIGGGQVNAINLPDTFTTTNMWHHMAFVNTGAWTRVYINGILLDSIPGAFGSVTGQPLTLGQPLTPTSGANETPFNGSLDEVRIWNTQRSAADIIDNMGNTLTGTETGLVGEFGFDEGVPGGNNTGLTTTLDNSSTGNNGTLQSFVLSGTTSNFNLHTLNATPLPLTLTHFTANRDGDASQLQWETGQEQNTLDFVVERSTNGLTYTPIGTVDAAGNSTSPRDYSFTDRTPLPNANYYRLKQTDIDGAYTYSPVCVVNFPTTNQLIWYTIGSAAVEVSFPQGNNEFYTVIDASGRLLRSGQLNNGRTDISGLPAGIYFVRIMTNTGPLVTKIVL